jgi:hypothetical protein
VLLTAGFRRSQPTTGQQDAFIYLRFGRCVAPDELVLL